MAAPKLPRRYWSAPEERMLRVHAKRYTAAQIAYRYGRTEFAIKEKARKLGIPLRKHGEMSPGRKHSDAVAREALRRYFRDGQKVKDIAVALGIPWGTVTGWTCGRERPHLYREFVGG